MSKLLPLTALVWAALGCLPSPAATDPTLSVTGVVTSTDGLVVPNASVEAVRLAGDNDTLNAAQLHWVETDNEGRFQLTLSPGRYQIRAKDEIDGYPDPNFMLSTDAHSDFPVIAVDSQDVSEIKVKLGAKGGILEGELLDKATRSPVERGKITIADSRRHDVFVEVFADKEGRFRFAVPSKPLKVSGSAPGYSAAGLDEAITLAGGEHRKITLELSLLHTRSN